MSEKHPARSAGFRRTLLTILNVAYPFAPVGPDAVGGAEQILTALDSAIVRAGHRSLVVACEGSACAGTLIPTPAWTAIDAAAYEPAHRAVREAVDKAVRRDPVDVVHFHGLDFAAYLAPPGPPVLATLHLAPDRYPPQALRPERPRTWLHCVSEGQHRTCPEGAPLLAPVPNGVDLEVLRPSRHPPRSFALSLGRICPAKGFHLALEAARRAGAPFVLGGEVFPYEDHQRYFREEIEPRLGEGDRFLGPLGLARKRRLLAAARCLVIPSQVAETSSLVAMEALACGTPVVAFRVGALPEIVEPGRTGFLVSGVEEMAEAIRQAETIDRRECRRAAEERFSADLMVSRYLNLYQDLAGSVHA
ncbi:MAG TPA: glycosyltransferase family 4 protein [Thermoanaerobaculia bacterium]|nr:glycosyltransferase family 4 protein [Thermoanaerobaculia bacterium]